MKLHKALGSQPQETQKSTAEMHEGNAKTGQQQLNVAQIRQTVLTWEMYIRFALLKHDIRSEKTQQSFTSPSRRVPTSQRFLFLLSEFCTSWRPHPHAFYTLFISFQKKPRRSIQILLRFWCLRHLLKVLHHVRLCFSASLFLSGALAEMTDQIWRPRVLYAHIIK